MTWTVWAVLLLVHGALSRWAKGSRFYAPASIVADGILIAIALITMEQLQDLALLDVLRIGVFFVAFQVPVSRIRDGAASVAVFETED